MIGLRLVYLGLAAVIFGSANAAPAPAPVYHPKVGEIVHVAPQNTHGGSSVGTGASVPHPHIVTGHADYHGNYPVAPVTHNSGSDHLKPHMPAPNEHGLGGIVRLDHVTANANHISQSRGALKNKVVSGAAVNNINNAKALVNMHHSAAHAHDQAAGAHYGEQQYHDGQSQHHFSTGNMQAGQHHAQESTRHQGHVNDHMTAAANHRTAANDVNGYDHAQYNHAQSSYNHATNAHASLNTALGHDAASSNAYATGNNQWGAHYAGEAANARHAASQSSVAAVASANRATGH